MAKKTKVDQIYKQVAKDQGMDLESANSYIGECMEDGDLLFTDGALYCAIRDTYFAAQDALKNYPEASAALAKHFGFK